MTTMLRGPRRSHTPAFKTKVVLVTVGREQTVAELAQQFDVQAIRFDAALGEGF
jgi:transposase-like protein